MPDSSIIPCELAFRSDCLLAEGPVWDSRSASLYWVDIEGKCIHHLLVNRGLHRRIAVDSMVGAVVLCTNGDLLGAMHSGLVFINPSSGETTAFAHPEKAFPKNRYNDGKCDPAGRWWIGTMSLTEAPGAGNLYMIDKDGSHVHQLGKLGISNGLAWTADKKTMYFIDTPARIVWAFDYDNDTGRIGNRRVAITVPEKEGYPDGMTIDNEDMLWIAHWDGWQVGRWNPHTGKKLASIPVPAARVTCCTFGGTQLSDLYITTASTGLNTEQLSAQPLAGSVFVAGKTGSTGRDAIRFHRME
ncbi:MAG: SMP-30/gluconolactonase/LRE family protein [Bacteroidota bacterium]|nr:SMP-30/gluconolactonase/LRE family protein [Bacteroidota bacterium]